MSTEQSRENLDYVMTTSYDSLMMDTDRTIDEFIVFTKDDEVVEILQGTGERSIFIDGMIEYFESVEEFERCQKLINLKSIILENGN
jgi:hypothetical protein